MMMGSYLLLGCFLIRVLPLVSVRTQICSRIFQGFSEEERITVVTNGGNKAFNEIGNCELFPIEEHFNIHPMAHIVALKYTPDVPGFRITMDSSKEHTITMEYQGKNIISRSARTGYTIMTLRLTTISLVQPINIMPQLLRIRS